MLQLVQLNAPLFRQFRSSPGVSMRHGCNTLPLGRTSWDKVAQDVAKDPRPAGRRAGRGLAGAEDEEEAPGKADAERQP